MNFEYMPELNGGGVSNDLGSYDICNILMLNYFRKIDGFKSKN